MAPLFVIWKPKDRSVFWPVGRSLVEASNSIKWNVLYQAEFVAGSNAYHFSWSNGLVEGHMNRIKVMKRQMYGRANVDLLRQKVLYTWPKV